jgi:hypothetical protein
MKDILLKRTGLLFQYNIQMTEQQAIELSEYRTMVKNLNDGLQLPPLPTWVLDLLISNGL